MDTTKVPYARTPWGAIFFVLVALIYDASPIDLLPDIIPILGWVDDATVTVILGLLAVFGFRKFAKARRAQKVHLPARQ